MKMEKVSIRKARLADLPVLLSQWLVFDIDGEKIEPEFCKLGKNAVAELKKHIRKQILAKDSIILIAVENGKILGFIFGAIKKNPATLAIKKVGRIHAFSVVPSKRKKGTGKKLLQKMFDWFKTKKVHYVSLGTLTNKTKTPKMYEHLGFKEVERQYWKKI